MEQGHEGGVEATDHGRPGVALLEGFMPGAGNKKSAVAVGSGTNESKDPGQKAVVFLVSLDSFGV